MMPSDLEEVEVKRGYWLYDGSIRKTVLILRLNYDVYIEWEKADGFDVTDEIPRLNSEGYSYAVAWPQDDFIFSTGSWSTAPNDRVLSLDGTVSYAEEIIRQHVDWLN